MRDKTLEQSTLNCQACTFDEEIPHLASTVSRLSAEQTSCAGLALEKTWDGSHISEDCQIRVNDWFKSNFFYCCGLWEINQMPAATIWESPSTNLLALLKLIITRALCIVSAFFGLHRTKNSRKGEYHQKKMKIKTGSSQVSNHG